MAFEINTRIHNEDGAHLWEEDHNLSFDGDLHLLEEDAE